MKNIILVISIIFLSGCVPWFNSTTNTSDISGIVRARGEYDNRFAYRHKYMNNSIKALPLIVTAGTIKNTGEFFAEIDFRVYNKSQAINFKYIDLYNSEGIKWEWEVYRNRLQVEKNRNFIIESYSMRIDSQINQLIKFFNDDAIYLKIIGDVNNFKRLDPKHTQSIILTLEYAKYLSQN